MNNTSNILHFSKNFNVSFSLICMNQNQITQKMSPTTMFITAQIKKIHITFSLVILIDKYQIKSAHKNVVEPQNVRLLYSRILHAGVYT